MKGTARVLMRTISHSRKSRILIAAVTLIILGLFGSVPVAMAQGIGPYPGSPGTPSQSTNPFKNPMQNSLPNIGPSNFPRPNHKQRQALLNYQFKQMKKHAEDLTELVSSLEKEIERSSPNGFSVEIAKKAKEVRKLAKTIEKEAKGY